MVEFPTVLPVERDEQLRPVQVPGLHLLPHAGVYAVRSVHSGI